MTISGWLRNDGPSSSVSVKDTIKYLYPKSALQVPQTEERSRFSQLLLEHGEKHLQDWGIIAYSSPSASEHDKANSSSSRKPDEIQWEQSPALRRPTGTSSSSTSGGLLSSISPHKPKRRTKRDKESFPTAHMAKIEGRLHLCSRSLVFEPTEVSRGIVRCPFARMEIAPQEFPSDSTYAAMCVEFVAKRHLVMKENNVIGPFESVPFPVRFRFTFLHSSPTSFVDLCTNLFDVSQTSKHRNSMQLKSTVNELLKPVLDRPFDRDNLVDVREQFLTSSLRCSILTALQSQTGVMVLTAERLYFQPARGVLSMTNTRAIKWSTGDVCATARRYHGLRDSALELYWKDGSSTLLAFERRHDRETVKQQLPGSLPCFTDRLFLVGALQEWQLGKINNFEYLLALNSAAGRSFHDLSRYPVFPWVIGDYESSKLDLTSESTFRDLTKPVGALDEKRLEYFRQRLANMHDMGEDFLYGTHYSAPGYVLYFLVRSMPEHMLCLQNGKFDAPDRMFHSIFHCFRCVLTNHADVKELIPEFYNPENDFDFLINARGLQLGATQKGDRVDDVALPPWARSARDFIKKNRKALESDICTRMLPRWIDLIFGCKARGDAAKEALNLFHPTAYLGPSDLADMQSEEERVQAELQATEFGIVPDQLFVEAHPLKAEKDSWSSDELLRQDIGRASAEENNNRETWELLDAPADDTQNYLHERGDHPELGDREPVKPESGTPDLWSKSLSSSHNDGASPERYSETDTSSHIAGSAGSPNKVDKISSMTERESPHAASPARDSDSLPKVQEMADSAIGLPWDMKVIERCSVHSDSVSAAVLHLDRGEEDRSLLITTSLDGSLKAHQVKLSDKSTRDQDKGGLSSTLSRFSYNTILNRAQLSQAATSQSKLTEYRSHSSRDPLASLVVALDGSGGSVAFAGGHDDIVLAYGVNSACAVASVYSHRDAVTGLDLLPRSPFDTGCNALWLDNSTHIMISGSWDATVKVWSASVSSGETVSVNREPLAELFDADSSIVCVSALSIPTGGIVIAAGCADGSFCVWKVHNDGMQVVLHNEPAKRGSGSCTVVRWASLSGTLHLYTSFSTGKLASYTLVDEGSLERKSAVSVGVSVLSMVHTNGGLLVGCADGSLRLVPLRDGVYFDSKPTLWNAVNNEKAPGISSISVAYSDENSRRCYCCTGGEDGSVALFELKQVPATTGS